MTETTRMVWDDVRLPITPAKTPFWPHTGSDFTADWTSINNMENPGQEPWREYIADGKSMICLALVEGKDTDEVLHTVRQGNPETMYRIGSVGIISECKEQSPGKIEFHWNGISKCKVLQVLDPFLGKNLPFAVATHCEAFSTTPDDAKMAKVLMGNFQEWLMHALDRKKFDPLVGEVVATMLVELSDARKTGDEGKVIEAVQKLMYYLAAKHLPTHGVQAAELKQMFRAGTLDIELSRFNYFFRRSSGPLPLLTAGSDDKDGNKKDDPQDGNGKKNGRRKADGSNSAPKPASGDIASLRAKFEETKDKINDEARREIEKYLMWVEKAGTGSITAETQNNHRWLEYALSWPHGVRTKDNDDLKKAQLVLEQSHFGLGDIKDIIIETLAVRLENPDAENAVFCFVGPPGVGKTSIGKSIAKSLDRKFVRESLGGARDDADIHGHRSTYIGAMPGKIVEGICRVGTENPVFMLDEVDKIGQDARGNPAQALMPVFDREQNSEFREKYLRFPVDLSQVFFITTANILETIPRPLQDRMEIIRIPGYFEHEKVEIAKLHLIPKQLRNAGLEGKIKLIIPDEAILHLITEYTFEAGVRSIDKRFNKIFRKIARERQLDKLLRDEITLGIPELEKYLGEPTTKTRKGYITKAGEITGLSVMTIEEGVSMGDILPIQCAFAPGRDEPGKGVSYTGNFGEVMRQSAKNALTCVKVFLQERDPEKLERFKGHIVDLGSSDAAQPKDGPSAGLAFACAILSSVLDMPAVPYLAMTGELDKKFRVTRIGGTKEKILGAERAGMKEVVLSKENEADFNKLPDQVKGKIKAHFVSDLYEALPIIFPGFKDGIPDKTTKA